MEDSRFVNCAQIRCITARVFEDKRTKIVRVIIRCFQTCISRIFNQSCFRRTSDLANLVNFCDVEGRVNWDLIIASKDCRWTCYFNFVRLVLFNGDPDLLFNGRDNCMYITSEVFLYRTPVVFDALFQDRFKRINTFNEEGSVR